MSSLVSVRPSWIEVNPGPPGAVARALFPKSIARSGRGAGAAGAATPVSFEKSIDSPPNETGLVGAVAASSALVSVAAAGAVAGAAAGDCCLLIDASLP